MTCQLFVPENKDGKTKSSFQSSSKVNTSEQMSGFHEECYCLNTGH